MFLKRRRRVLGRCYLDLFDGLTGFSTVFCFLSTERISSVLGTAVDRKGGFFYLGGFIFASAFTMIWIPGLVYWGFGSASRGWRLNCKVDANGGQLRGGLFPLLFPRHHEQ